MENNVTDYEKEWLRQDNKDLVLGFISAMAKCDIEQFESVLSPNVVWTIPGTSLVSGPAYGIDGIIKRCQIIRNYNVRLDLQHMLYTPYDNLVAAVLRNTGMRRIGYRGEGVIKFNEDVTQVYEIGDDGKIQSITNFISDLDNLNYYFQ